MKGTFWVHQDGFVPFCGLLITYYYYTLKLNKMETKIKPFCILVTEQNRDEVRIFFLKNFPVEVKNYNPGYCVGFHYGLDLEYCQIHNFDKHKLPEVLTLSEAKARLEGKEFPRMMLVKDKCQEYWQEKLVYAVVDNIGCMCKSEEKYCSVISYEQYKELPEKTQVPRSEIEKLGISAKAKELGIDVDDIEITEE